MCMFRLDQVISIFLKDKFKKNNLYPFLQLNLWLCLITYHCGRDLSGENNRFHVLILTREKFEFREFSMLVLKCRQG